MSFSYDVEQLSSTPLYQVRFLLGDTTDSGHKVEDEEIEWALQQEPDVWYAAAFLADTLASKYSGKAQTKAIGEMSLTYRNLADEFAALAARLRDQRGRKAVPMAFGWKKSERDTLEADTDREPIVSRKGGMDYPGLPKRA